MNHMLDTGIYCLHTFTRKSHGSYRKQCHLREKSRLFPAESSTELSNNPSIQPFSTVSPQISLHFPCIMIRHPNSLAFNNQDSVIELRLIKIFSCHLESDRVKQGTPHCFCALNRGKTSHHRDVNLCHLPIDIGIREDFLVNENH